MDEEGNDLPVGEIGEVVVRSDVCMSGYWSDPEATAKALRDGWLYTGDVGSVSEEGYLTLKDRSKDLIISGGMNIYPCEIEEVILLHPGCLKCRLSGARMPNGAKTWLRSSWFGRDIRLQATISMQFV